MILFILKNKKFLRITCAFMLVCFLNMIVAPMALRAQSQGPAQVEHQGYSPSSSSEMVNLFTGDFSYSIPLLEVDGYPLVLGYNADIKLEQESSWVGLGWSLNPGALSRGIRGLPDDFNDDIITEENSLKVLTDKASENGAQVELAVPVTSLVDQIIKVLSNGAAQKFLEHAISINLGLNAKAAVNIGENSYTHSYIDLIFDNGINLGLTLDPQGYSGHSLGIMRGNGLGVSLSSRSGIGLNPSSMHGNVKTQGVPGVASVSTTETKTISSNYSTRAGLSEIAVTQGSTRSISVAVVSISKSSSGTTMLFPGTSTYTPYSPTSRMSIGSSFFNSDGFIVDPVGLAKGYAVDNNTAYISAIIDTLIESEAHGYLHHQDVKTELDKEQLMDFNRASNKVQIPRTMPRLAYAFQTQDNYIATGSGMNVQFQPRRNDMGFVFDPYRHEINLNATFTRKVARDPRGAIMSKTTGKLLSAAAHLVFDVPPFIDEFVLKGGFNYPFEFTHSDGGGTSVTKMGGWLAENGNLNQTGLAFIGTSPINPDYEPVYFKEKGEITASRNDITDNTRPNSPSVNIEVDTTDLLASVLTMKASGGKNQERDIRNTLISNLTNEESHHYGFSPDIISYGTIASDGTYSVLSTTSKSSTSLKSHHLGEFAITQDGGTRYIYGTPVNNNTQKEVSFSLSPNQLSSCALTAKYIPGIENSRNNSSGKLNYFKSVTTPKYATTFLLDAVLSPDYVDVSGDGISDDDLGGYTQFRYTKVNSSYKWRVPYSEGEPTTSTSDPFPRAAYSVGFFNSYGDEMASYVYGEKELWYVQSIEGETQVAEFYISNRHDGFGVQGEDGEIDLSAPLKKLDKIVLYNKQERQQLGADAEPIKTVYFDYDYSLCQNIPSNDTTLAVGQRGKLTLTKVWMTYGKSQKGVLSPYEFTYNDDYNFDYSEGSVDRWGDYKPQNCPTTRNQIYPYSIQTGSQANYNAKAWKLSEIALPSGANIEINYEADNYSKVQDKDAMKMFSIAGFGLSEAFSTGNDLYIAEKGQALNYPYLFFELDEPVPYGTSASYVKNNYLGDMTYLFFKVFSKLMTGNASNEYYNGYVPIAGSGFCPDLDENDNYTHGWIKIDPVRVVDENENVPDLPPFIEAILPSSESHTKIHPIAKAGWQHMRLSQNELIYPEMDCSVNLNIGNALGLSVDLSQLSTANSDRLTQLNNFFPSPDEFLGLTGAASAGASINEIFSIFSCLKQYLTGSFGLDFAALTQGGINIALMNKGAAREIDLSESYIRLEIPSRTKYGGGYRVSSIYSQDGWDEMGGSYQYYGQEYDYSTVDEFGNEITSGVASYEPSLGNDENPWHQPIFYDVENILYPDDHHFFDEPIGEELYSSAMVGYGRVTSKNIDRSNVSTSATGWKEYEFYTAADFPTRVYATDLRHDEYNQAPVTTHKNKSKDTEAVTADYYCAAQGFSVVLNDMHGKPRSRSIFNEGGDIRNKVTYHYHSEPGDKAGTFNLKNKVKVYKSDASTESDVEMGVDYDFTTDTRYSSTENSTSVNSRSYNISISLNFDKGQHIQKVSKRFGSATRLKVVTQYGIVERTEIKDGSSTIVQKNLAYDENNGSPVLVSVQNDWGKPVNSFTYPAYWMHEGMAHAYQNQGLTLVEIFTAGEIVDSDAKIQSSYNDWFSAGDEVLAKNLTTGSYEADRYWVGQGLNGTKKLIDRDGDLVTFTGGSDKYQFTIIRSGKRNQISETAGSITTLKPNPLTYDSVLSVSAQQYKDDWQTYCGIDTIYPGPTIDSATIFDLINFLNTLITNNEIPSAGSSSTVNLAPYYFPAVYAATYPAWSGCTAWKLKETNSVGSSILNLVLQYQCNNSTPIDFVTSTNIPVPSGLTKNNLVRLIDPAITATGLGYIVLSMKAVYDNGDTINASTGEVYFKPGEQICETTSSTFCGLQRNDVINPYITGNKGNFRPYRSYTYFADERKVKATPETRKDGMFKFHVFWNGSSLNPITEVGALDSAAKHWLLTQQVNITDPYGNVLETQDALGLRSANLMGYNYTKTIASAANASYRQIAYDGFEDYNLFEGSCNAGHLNFHDYKATNWSNAFAHTGRYSMKVLPEDSIDVSRPMTKIDEKVAYSYPFKVRKNDCAGTFSPYNEDGLSDKYVVSYWVKLGNTVGSQYSYDAADVDLEIDCNVLTPISVSKSNVIDGWQRFEKIYAIPASSDLAYIKVILGNEHATSTAYFDDLRIHPRTAAMQSTVYDPLTNRLVASLDDRNFATFYKYDNQGRLTATLKETEKGIFTLNETRSSIAKK